MTKTKLNTITDSSWDIPFWFAVLSPVLGILAGFLGVLLFYNWEQQTENEWTRERKWSVSDLLEIKKQEWALRNEVQSTDGETCFRAVAEWTILCWYSTCRFSTSTTDGIAFSVTFKFHKNGTWPTPNRQNFNFGSNRLSLDSAVTGA